MIVGSILASIRSFERYGVSVYSSKLADRLQCEMKATGINIAEECGLILQENLSDGAVELAWGAKSGVREVPFRIDFNSITSKQRSKMSKSELVSKAMGSKTSNVIDMTAGLGRDSFILASSGYNVYLLERNPVIFHLLHDAINRLRITDPILAGRMNLVERDSRELLNADDLGIVLKEAETVAVYLDPMYEGNVVGKRSNVKKETAMLHRIINSSPVNDADNGKLLFDAAKRLSNSRIIVKRSVRAASLANTVPHEVLEGSTQRFDIYFKNRKILDAFTTVVA